MTRKRGRQSAGRTAVSINQVCQGFSSHGARIEGIKHRIGSFFDLFDTVRSSSDQKHHQRFSQFGKLQDQFLLGSRNMAHGAVHTLAAVHGKASALLGDGSVFVKNCSSETRGGTTCCHHDDIALFRKFQRLLKLRPVGLIEAGTHRIFHRNTFRSLVFHSGKNGHTGALRHGRGIISQHRITVSRMVADEGNLLIMILQRKNLLFIFQKDSGLSGQF